MYLSFEWSEMQIDNWDSRAECVDEGLNSPLSHVCSDVLLQSPERLQEERQQDIAD